MRPDLAQATPVAFQVLFKPQPQRFIHHHELANYYSFGEAAPSCPKLPQSGGNFVREEYQQIE
jgi:hypothetical protein